jgi:V8-like Glu-specific endopeptidase
MTTGRAVNDGAQLHAEIAKAVAEFDWAAVRRLAGDLAGRLQATSELDPQVPGALKLLLANRQYGAVADVADAALAIDPGNPALGRHYAQALVDQGRTAPALRMYASMADDPNASPEDYAEARGGIGRCYKQLFLAATDSERRVSYLRRALEAYGGLYYADQRLYWHGINSAALLAYAARQSITVPGIGSPQQSSWNIAAEVLKTVEHLEDPWAAATACEAYVALGEFEQAVKRAEVFVANKNTQAFMVASFLRQLMDVWQLHPDSRLGTTLLTLLRSELVRKSGGTVTLTVEDVAASRLENLDRLQFAGSATGELLEKVLGTDRFQTLQWWRTGLERCRAVVRIDDLNGVGLGTGFLVKGSNLHHLLPEAVVVTNWHVVPQAIDPEDAQIAFHGLDADLGPPPRFRVQKMHWYSPLSPPGVDTTLLELEGLPEGVQPIPLVNRFPHLTKTSRAYIIGHPRGYDQPQFSIQDNLVLDLDGTRLHYRAPTEGGSSGSPVFESQWRVIGLHHSGSVEMPRLNAKGTYPANEALRIDAIRDALRRHPPGTEAPALEGRPAPSV